MSARTRALAAVVTVAVLIVLFVALRPGDDDPADSVAATQPASTTAASTPTATTPSADPTTSTSAAPAPAPEPEVTRIRVRDLKPVGGEKKLKAEKGDTVRFQVTSDQPENVHLHGYDVEKDVGPAQTASFTFKAKIEGIFEIELENSAVPLASLTVEP